MMLYAGPLTEFVGATGFGLTFAARDVLLCCVGRGSPGGVDVSSTALVCGSGGAEGKSFEFSEFSSLSRFFFDETLSSDSSLKKHCIPMVSLMKSDGFRPGVPCQSHGKMI